MNLPPITPVAQLTRRDPWIAAAIFTLALVLFWRAPVNNVGDSKYTLLVTQSLLSRGSFLLDGYGIPHRPPTTHNGAVQDGDIYQIEVAGPHFYYFFPPGSSILSAPFVLIGDLFGGSVVRPDGSFDALQEVKDQVVIAAVLMAGLAAVFYFTARMLLPMGWSALVSLGGVLGTQIYSTASRALWNHTWGVALLGFALLLLLAHETGQRKLPPILLATVLSWAYFVRPTNSIFIVGVTIYLLCCHRRYFVPYALTGAGWFAGFVCYSWFHFGHLLPAYFQGNRLHAATLPEALAGNLVSPSRGLLIFVPVVLFIVYLPLRFRRYLPWPRLVVLVSAVSACQYVAVSGFEPWNGGWCYGPRYTTELVPSMVLVACLGLAAALRWREDYAVKHNLPAWRATLAAGGGLLLLSIAINAHGANDNTVSEWNQFPVNVDQDPGHVWDWRHPQFLAGLVSTPPDVFPVAATGQRIFFAQEAGRAFQLDGWSHGEDEWCWSELRRATLIFAVSGPVPRQLRLFFGSHVNGSHPRQRIGIRLNGRNLANLDLSDPEPREHTFALPTEMLQPKNVLTFDLPDAFASRSSRERLDLRLLAISLRWMELSDQPAPTPPTPSP